MSILEPVLCFAVLGLVVGLLLAIASHFLAVNRDKRIDAVQDALPGANCGGCGYAGCASLAEAIVKGEVKMTACTALDASSAKMIAEIMGVEAEHNRRMVAHVMCSGTPECAKRRFTYADIYDCHSAEVLGGGDKYCAAGCTGLGSCVNVCAFDAISVRNGVAVVDRNACRGCGVCVTECPKHIIHLIPAEASHAIQCASPEKGKIVRMYCDAGCIGCHICEKHCSAGAIRLVGDIAAIDYDACTGCGNCVAKCPRKIIRILVEPQEGPVAVDAENCNSKMVE